MNLDDALSCGEVIKVRVREGFYAYEETQSNLNVRYVLVARFNNTKNSHRSDVGILLENIRKLQQWTVETKEDTSSDVSLVIKWRSNFYGTTNPGFEIYQRDSNKGYSALFDNKARIEQGRILDYLYSGDKEDIRDLAQIEADLIVANLEPKKFKDPKRQNEEVVGILQDNVNSLLSNTEGEGISSNSILAALVKSVQGLTTLVRALYAKKIGEYSRVSESIVCEKIKVGLTMEDGNIEEKVSYTITQ